MGFEFVGFCEFFQFDRFNVVEWFIGVITTFVLIFMFRARIRVNEIFIETDKKGKRKIKIPVLNKSYFFFATNVIIEVAIIEGKYSYHFELDRKEFILISNKCFRNSCKGNIRTFQTMNFEQATINLLDDDKDYETVLNNISNNTTLRVRIHANHEFTNFGKAFEFDFRYDGAKFIKI
jgi:hypothetical protein